MQRVHRALLGVLALLAVAACAASAVADDLSAGPSLGPPAGSASVPPGPPVPALAAFSGPVPSGPCPRCSRRPILSRRPATPTRRPASAPTVQRRPTIRNRFIQGRPSMAGQWLCRPVRRFTLRRRYAPYTPACPSCDGGEPIPAGNPNYGYFDTEIFYAQRNNTSHNQPLVVDSGTGQTDLSTHDLKFSFEPGWLTTIGYMTSQGWGLEGTYWGQFGFSTGYVLQGANNLSLPGALGTGTMDYNGVSQMAVTYNSDVNNFELNFVVPFDNVQFLTGFRYFELDELLDISGNPGFESSDYLVRTHNDLWGWQLGGRGLWYWGRVEFSVALKAGIYGDSANEQQLVGDKGNSVLLRDASATQTTAAFIGELGAYVKVPLTPWMALRGGYTAVWATNLALAPNQLDFTNTPSSGQTHNTHSSLLLDGLNIGLETRW